MYIYGSKVKVKKARRGLCLLLAVAMSIFMLFALAGCGDNSTTQVDLDSQIKSDTESDVKTAYVNRNDYTLLGDFYFKESYEVRNDDDVVIELGLDMYTDEEFTNADGVLAIYYDDDGNMTKYEAYLGLSPIRSTVTYFTSETASYFTCFNLDSDGVMTSAEWDNVVTNTNTEKTYYYTGYENYSEGFRTDSREEIYLVVDEENLTLVSVAEKEYQSGGLLAVDRYTEYDSDGNEMGVYLTDYSYDSNGIAEKGEWENTVTDSDSGDVYCYVGWKTFYEDGSTKTYYEEKYLVSDDWNTLVSVTEQEYDEEGNLTLDETTDYAE